jgi:opacity protein-like surface antigen
MKKLLALSLIMTSLSLPAQAADCIEKACIDVYTQDGKIVIEGRKGSGPVEKKAVAPAPVFLQRWHMNVGKEHLPIRG